MLPVGDYPNPPRAQWVTRVLIGLNIAIYLFISAPLSEQRFSPQEQADPETAAVLAEMWEWQQPHLAPQGVSAAQFASSIDKYSVFTFQYGYRPASPSLLALLFCMFLHGGFGHLFGNMLFLWIYGDNVEYRLGPLAFLAWYLATGIVATLTFAFLDSTSLAPLVGASGAISGVLGFYLIWFPHNYVKVFFLFPFFGIIPIRAYWILGIYLVLENIMPALGGAASNVAYGAHIGGFIAGAIVALIASWRVRQWPAIEDVKDSVPEPGELAAARDAPGGLLGQFRRELASGRVAEASRLFFGAGRQLERAGLGAADAVRLGQALEEGGQPRAALSAYERTLALRPSPEVGAAAQLGAARVLAGPLDQPTSAYQHVVAAVNTHPSDAVAADAASLMAQIRPQVGSLPTRFI